MRRTLALTVAVLFPGCARVPFTTDSLPAIRASLASGRAVLLDVRENDEWFFGHLERARLFPLSRVQALTRAPETLPADRPIYLYCAEGPRAQKAAAILLKYGLDARPIGKGYRALVAEGFEDVPMPRIRAAG